jgi:multidrug efflux system membrane fusion protein
MNMITNQTRATSSRRWVWLVGLVLLVAAAAALGATRWHRGARDSAAGGPPRAIPVTVVAAETQDVPIFLSAPATVQAWNTVAVRSQIDGKLIAVNFAEGQDVREGFALAEIESGALKAAVDQAVAKQAEDEAQLAAAEKDLARAQTLVQRQAVPQQTVDQQQAKVDQLKATVDADQAAIEAARVQLGYATIVAPIDGRIGLRQLDRGNIIRAGDPNPLTIITQIRPAAIVFTLPQKSLFDVREAMLRGAVATSARDQDDKQELAQGELSVLDNQIDQATSTIRLKARFANADERLWPGEFVRVRALVDTRRNAVTIPSPALQRGPQGFYVWVVQPNDTAEPRAVEAAPADDTVTIVTKGLSPGERIVVEGQSRLEAGTRVEPRSRQAAQTPG